MLPAAGWSPAAASPAGAASDHDPCLLRDRAIHTAISALVTKPVAAMLMLNVDRFGRINQRFGTRMADTLLDQLAARIDAAIAPSDVVACSNGGEFVILRQQLGQIDQLQDLATRLLQSFEAPFRIGGSLIQATATIGIARAPHDGTSLGDLLASARAALCSGKVRSPGDRQFFSAGMLQLLRTQDQLRRDLLCALSQGEMFMLYEPMIGLHTGRIEAFEAQPRWRHPELGVLTPDVFMPLAEQRGSHVPMANWLLRQACRDATEWPASINLAVKLPARFFGIDNAESSVSAALQRSRLAACRLELGVPAPFLLEGDEFDISELSAIRRQGVRIALDDLGSGFGYSGMLNGLYVDKIKLDTRCLLRAPQDLKAPRFAPFAEARARGVATVATGVTSFAEFDALREVGCMQAQGALLSAPVSAVAASKAMASSPFLPVTNRLNG